MPLETCAIPSAFFSFKSGEVHDGRVASANAIGLVKILVERDNNVSIALLNNPSNKRRKDTWGIYKAYVDMGHSVSL